MASCRSRHKAKGASKTDVAPRTKCGKWEAEIKKKTGKREIPQIPPAPLCERGMPFAKGEENETATSERGVPVASPTITMKSVFCLIRTTILHPSLFSLLVLGVLFICAPVQTQPGASSDSPPVKLTEGWEYRRGEAPLDGRGVPLWTYNDLESPEWKPTKSTMNPPERQGRHNLWLRVKLPVGQWKNPALFIPSVSQTFEVYLADRLAYKSGELQPSGKNKWLFRVKCGNENCVMTTKRKIVFSH